MECTCCYKQIILKFIITLLCLKASDMEKNLHMSRSVIRRHVGGLYYHPEIDIYIIEKAFGLKVKDYTVNE